MPGQALICVLLFRLIADVLLKFTTPELLVRVMPPAAVSAPAPLVLVRVNVIGLTTETVPVGDVLVTPPLRTKLPVFGFKVMDWFEDNVKPSPTSIVLTGFSASVETDTGAPFKFKDAAVAEPAVRKLMGVRLQAKQVFSEIGELVKEAREAMPLVVLLLTSYCCA